MFPLRTLYLTISSILILNKRTNKCLCPNPFNWWLSECKLLSSQQIQTIITTFVCFIFSYLHIQSLEVLSHIVPWKVCHCFQYEHNVRRDRQTMPLIPLYMNSWTCQDQSHCAIVFGHSINAGPKKICMWAAFVSNFKLIDCRNDWKSCTWNIRFWSVVHCVNSTALRPVNNSRRTTPNA